MKKFFLMLFLVWLSGNCLGADGVLPGEGTSDSPYLIEDKADFNAFCSDSSKWLAGVYVKMASDIALSGSTFETALIAYDTSGSSGYQGQTYSGSFDGDNHTIYDLSINNSRSYVGLFGMIGSEGSVSNLNLKDVKLISSDGDGIGGLCGINYGSINSCYVTGSVDIFSQNSWGSTDSGGGLCGANNNGSISNSYFIGSVTGRAGLCGKNSATITNCYSSVSARYFEHNDYNGGFCNVNYGVITNCYVNGTISAIAYGFGYDDEPHSFSVGAFCGRNRGEISNSYANNFYEVVQEGGLAYVFTYGFCSRQDASSAIMQNCFWDIEKSGRSVGYDNDSGTVDNVLGLTTAEMQTEATYTDAGWDLSVDDGDAADWTMPVNGYPLLGWQLPIAVISESSLSIPAGYYSSVALEFQVASMVSEPVDWTISGIENCSWISSATPSIGCSNPTESVTVNIADDLVVGDYTCELIFRDLSDRILIKPISLHVYAPVDSAKIELLAENWLQGNCIETDYYLDGVIDMLDFGQLAQCWLMEDVTYIRNTDGDGFETGNITTFNWELSEDPNYWHVDSTHAFEGDYSARAGTITVDQPSTLSTTFVCTDVYSVSFVYWISSEDDTLNFYIDGVQQDPISGMSNSWAELSYTIDSGVHTLEWIYSKRFMYSSDGDVWIDDVKFVPVAPL